jgi:hypothetical protein
VRSVRDMRDCIESELWDARRRFPHCKGNEVQQVPCASKPVGGSTRLSMAMTLRFHLDRGPQNPAPSREP